MPRINIRRLMLAVLAIGVALAVARSIGPRFGFPSTVYSSGYSESKFLALRVGMTAAEVEAAIGPPLRKEPRPEESGLEMWYFSDQTCETCNFWQRWVCFQDGVVIMIIADFWVD